MKEQTRLIVIEAFDDYRRGDEIKKEEDINHAIKFHKEKVHCITEEVTDKRGSQ